MFICPLCQQELHSARAVRYHNSSTACARRVAKRKRLTCENCGHIFSALRKLKNHLENKFCQKKATKVDSLSIVAPQNTKDENEIQDQPTNPNPLPADRKETNLKETKNHEKQLNSSAESVSSQSKKRKRESTTSPLSVKRNGLAQIRASNSSEQKSLSNKQEGLKKVHNVPTPTSEHDEKLPFCSCISPDPHVQKNVSRAEELMIFLECLDYLGTAFLQTSHARAKMLFDDCVKQLDHNHPLHKLYAEYTALVALQPPFTDEHTIPNFAFELRGAKLTPVCVSAVSHFLFQLRREYAKRSPQKRRQYAAESWTRCVGKIREEFGSDSFERLFEQYLYKYVPPDI